MVLLPFPCWKKPTTTSTALLILTEAYVSLTRRSTPALHLQKFHHTRPGCYITVLGGGRGGEGVRWRSWRAWMTNAFFFPFYFYGGNSLLMNAGRVCSAAHQNPEATRHFASYVTPARQSGNNGGNNLDLSLKSIRRTFRRIPLSLIVSIPSPHTLHLQWENVSFLNTQTSHIW